jgi:hypothetical protein
VRIEHTAAPRKRQRERKNANRCSIDKGHDRVLTSFIDNEMTNLTPFKPRCLAIQWRLRRFRSAEADPELSAKRPTTLNFIFGFTP